jgi:hypothetical protein
MLVASRLAGLSALETYYAGLRARTQFGPTLVGLTYETEAEAKEAHGLMAKVINGATITPHS